MSPSGTTGSAAAKASLPLVAATTAVLPAVALSSLALAVPAEAAPSAPQQLPGTLAAAMERTGHQAAVVPASEIASLVPSRLAPLENGAPSEYTIVAGDTVWAIAHRFGLSVSDVLRLNDLRPDSLIFPGKKLRLTADGAPAPAAPAPAAPAPSSGGEYAIKAGDTLYGISAKLGVSIGDLLSANGLRLDSVIYAGRSLKVPGSGPAPAPALASTSAPAPSAPGGTYAIKPGDTLYGISAKLGVPMGDLLAANGLSLTSVIYAGRTLKLPGAPAPASAVSPATSSPVQPLVPDTFLGFTYPEAVVASANENKQRLNASPVPSREEMKQIVADTARSMGVDPSLALAVAYQESGFSQRAVSPANAIGTMQVIPTSGQWASDLVGRKLNVLDPYDNATAGVAILRALLRTSKDEDHAIAGYYQGQYSVDKNGMYDDTKDYVAAINAHRATFR
ncbi:lytic transglycosylase domain-containing protein [Sinomonas mesophila]|uniref:lytic transglycosylase domain-containing protein n=1 Tax=Sinomonas mesophila TaxID=1531955 RepID=UPI0009850EEA|nr:lytic transglycosylase domain-containing protein [Sinomonas mesophila]